MAAFGLDPSGDLPDEPSREKAAYGVHADVADVFELFLECQGSWRIGLMGGLQGLVKSDVIALAGAMEIPLDRDALALLGVCEAEFIRVYNRRQKAHGRRS